MGNLIKSIQDEWQSFDKRQKIIISIYVLLSLPLMPVLGPMVVFSHWVTQSDGIPRRNITFMEFICMCVAMSLFCYFFGTLLVVFK